MDLEQVTYQGPPIDDEETLGRLPAEVADFLRQLNGFIQFQGGFHLRGACFAPDWHSLRHAWEGEHAFQRLYPNVAADDIPFAEDALGDQYLLRQEKVWCLAAETGELTETDLSFLEFLEHIQANPESALHLEPLLAFVQAGEVLEPGEQLAAWPPFCTTQAEQGVELARTSSAERRRFLAEFAAQIRDVPEGGQFSIEVVE